MMKKPLFVFAAIVILVIVLLRPWDQPAAAPPAQAPAKPGVARPAVSVPAPDDPRVSPVAPVPPAAAPALSHADRQRAMDAIDNLSFALRDFATALGGNPVGTNAEITAALVGDNLKQVKIPIPDGSTINNRGELCDPWGSPWFFHQLSGTQMEIRSAGPDRQMWSGDDVTGN